MGLNTINSYCFLGRLQKMKVTVIFTTFIFILTLTVCSDASEEVVVGDGFYVGYKKINVESKTTDERFSVALVYPTETPPEQIRFGPFEMELSVGGKMTTGKFPLVIISHGSGGTNLGYRSIAFALVKKGFVVGMPLHPKNNFKENEAEGTISNWKNRPLHISSSIDSILSNRKISENIDFDKIAVIGHSAGGYTALAVAGGVADTSHIIELCLSNSQINESFCGLVKDNKTKAVKIENSHDKRVKAIVLMAPVGILFKSENSLAEVDIPILLLNAEKDDELTEPYHSEIIVRNYKNKELLTYCTIPNAGHYSFITPFPEAMKHELGIVGEDPEGFDRSAFHQLLSTDIVNFLDNALNTKHNKKLQPTSCLGS